MHCRREGSGKYRRKVRRWKVWGKGVNVVKSKEVWREGGREIK